MTAIQRALGYPGRKGLLAKWIDRYIRWGNEKRLKRSLGGDEPVAIQTQPGLCRIIVRYGKTDPSPFDIVLNGLDYTDCIPIQDASFPAGAKDHLSSGSMISNMIPSGSRK